MKNGELRIATGYGGWRMGSEGWGIRYGNKEWGR